MAAKPPARALKCVAVGDGSVGKTCLLIAFISRSFNGEYTPTVFDNYETTITFQGLEYALTLFDTAGQEDYDRLRPLSYSQTNVFLLCFAVNNPASFENISERWIPEISHHAPDASLVLVGTKIDTREPQTPKNEKSFIWYPQATKLCKEKREYPIFGYVECSAMYQTNIRNVFDTAIRACIEKSNTKKEKPSKCLVL